MFFYVHKTASKTIEIAFFYLLNGYKVLILLLNYVRLKCLIKWTTLITVKVTIIELNEIPSMNHLLKVISHDQQ